MKVESIFRFVQPDLYKEFVRICEADELVNYIF